MEGASQPGTRGGRCADCHDVSCALRAALAGGEGCPAGYDLASLPHRMGELVVVDQPVVAWFHARGVRVHVWTVDDAADMGSLLRLGVDGIVTDRPDVLKRVMGR